MISKTVPDDIAWSSAFDDPRLISAGHSGQRLLLDAPARRDGGIKTIDGGWKIGRPYPSYESIRGGDIKYYADASINVPFITPILFDPTSTIVKRTYIDPMMSCKPTYDFNVDVCPPPPTCDMPPPVDGLTFLYDTRMHRQDMMKRQLYRRNWTQPMVI